MPQTRRTLQKKVVWDLSGGLVDSVRGQLIKDSEATVATNVFCNLRGGVEKRYGFTSNTGPVSSVNSQFCRLLNFSPQSITPGDTILLAANNDVYLPNITNIQTGGVNYFPTYSNGTATFTNGSATVTLATGTAEWSTQVVKNDLISHNFVQGTASTWFTVSSVTDNSTIVLTSNFTGTTGTYTYAVRQRVLSYPVKGCMYNGSLFYGPGIGVNGGTTTSPGTIIYYNGTKTQRTAASPAGIVPGIFCAFKNYLFTVDINYQKNSRLWWSALLNATTSAGWPASNFIDVSPDDGQSIRAIYVHNDSLFIIKDKDIYYLSGNVFDPSNVTYSLNKFPNPYSIGTYHGDSVRSFQNRLHFLGQDGIYATNGYSGVVNVSEPKIRVTFRTFNNQYLPVSLSGANPEAVGIVYDNRYWLSIQDNTTSIGTNNVNNKTICIEPNGAFSLHTIAVQSWVLAQGATKYVLLGVDASTWNIIQFDGTSGNDGSVATNATWTSKVFTFSDFTKTSHVVNVFVAYVNGTGQAATLQVYDDGGQVGSSAAWTFPGGNNQKITVQRFAVDRDTNSIFLTVTDNTAGSGFVILGYAIEYEKDMEGSGVIVNS